MGQSRTTLLGSSVSGLVAETMRPQGKSGLEMRSGKQLACVLASLKATGGGCLQSHQLVQAFTTHAQCRPQTPGKEGGAGKHTPLKMEDQGGPLSLGRTSADCENLEGMANHINLDIKSG